MLGRLQRRFAKYQAGKNKSSFIKGLPLLLQNIPATNVDYDVVSFSGAKYFADQLYSIFSFVYNVGRPVSWRVFNDGSYTSEQKQFLLQLPGVSICEVNTTGCDLGIKAACEQFPTLKKMVIFQKIDPVRSTLLADSDIIFYKPFGRYLKQFSSGNHYIVDESSSYFDQDYLSSHSTITHPLNLGFLLLNKKPDWTIAFAYIRQKIQEGKLHYWTDQTATHIMATSSGDFAPLDQHHFVNAGSDSFTISHHHDYRTIALRHFVGPIRHKMWQYPWKKVIGY